MAFRSNGESAIVAPKMMARFCPVVPAARLAVSVELSLYARSVMFPEAWDGEVQSSPDDRTLSQPRTGEKASDAARLVQIPSRQVG
jgi:hypothetical protein